MASGYAPGSYSRCESVTNPKTAQPGVRQLFDASVLDVAGHLCGYGLQKSVHRFRRPFRNQLDRAVGQILDIARNRKSAGDVLGGITKTDALHPAGVVNALADAHGKHAVWTML